MKKIGIFLLVAGLFFNCKQKKPSLSGEEPVEVEDFIESFTPLILPFQVSDSSLGKKEKDSALINYKILTQFVPDSVISKSFGKNVKPNIYPFGRVDVSKDEKYVVVKAISGNKKEVLLLAFNEENKFGGAMYFLQVDADKTTQQLSVIDKKFTIHKNVYRKKPDGTVSDGKEVYVYNGGAAQFMLIMTDALDESITELINPIDTFSRKHKFSGDYLKDIKNMVSIRDGRKPDRLSFFVHVEKNSRECTGELKGEASFVNSNTAVYRVAGEQCVLQFSFSASSVTLKELEACGSRRGIKCLFDGNYPRKKEITPKTTKTKTPAKK